MILFFKKSKPFSLKSVSFAAKFRLNTDLQLSTIMSNITFSSAAESHIFKQKALAWGEANFDTLCYLESNHNTHNIDNQCFIAIGVTAECCVSVEGDAFEQLKNFCAQYKDWLFGHLTYDLKNEVETKLKSENPDQICFPALYFFKPKILIKSINELDFEFILNDNDIAQDLITEIRNTEITPHKQVKKDLKIQAQMSRAQYLEKVAHVRNHIQKGDIYEMNLCQAFFVEHVELNPLAVFEALNALAKTPFTAFYKIKNKYALCASPERFLKKEAQKLIAQPIKGTIRRGKNAAEDLQLSNELYNSAKDRSENVMIVDLMRNDLGRICQTGSVTVKELFGIYPYSNVFQMISTIEGNLKPNIHFIEALRQCYPMGSMTGAPKIRAMELIEQYEETKRGLYSGSIGYITPEGDFDFNVIIRSVLYNADNQYLSFQVGGAIVYDSVPEAEYEECLLKANLIFKILEQELGAVRN